MTRIIPFRPRTTLRDAATFRDWKETAENAANDTHDTDILHLAELVEPVRRRLAIGPDFSDDAILVSLKRIASRTYDRDRWRAAFESNLALWLSAQGRELGSALTTLIAMLPPPRQ